MRLLHTSDWHLGRTLHNESLIEAQRTVLQQIVDIVDSHAVDAVLVAGDVFDRAVPPVESVTLLADTLQDLTSRVPVVLISGNHDSAVRLGFGAHLFADRLHVRTRAAAIGQPVELLGPDGPLLVYAIPFLDPDTARHALSDSDEPLERSHEAVVAAAMNRVRRDLSRRETEAGAALRSVVMAHAFVVGGTGADIERSRSESERDIRVGGTDCVPAHLFEGVDYVALGHLHGAQQPRLPDRETARSTLVRYSGSPLRYSFSEVAHTKSVTLLELDPCGSSEISTVPLAQPREMAVLVGAIDDLLDPQRHLEVVDRWVQITVTDSSRPEQMFSRLHDRFPHALQVRHVPAYGPLLVSGGGKGVEALDPIEVAESFVHYVTGGDATTDELAVFLSAYESVSAAERGG